MRSLHLAEDAGIFADDHQARVARGDHVTMHFAVDADAICKTQIALQHRAFADQASDGRCLAPC
jgi:hypothetical protein